MTRDEVRRWIEEEMRAGGGLLPVYVGARDALKGEFVERRCAPAGKEGESQYCKGGREALARLKGGGTTLADAR
jgi:hypothetical protein